MLVTIQKIIHFLKLHPLVYRGLRLLAMLLGLLLAVVLYVAVVGVSVDASGQRGKLGALLSKALGREVRFEGEMQLEVSARPKLKVGGMHIANAAGFAGGDFASLGEARLALDLWPLLRMRFQVEELAGSDVHLRLQLLKDGRNNWTLKPAAQQADAPQPAAGQADSAALERMLARLDIKRVALEKLDVEFVAANGKSHFFELESLVAQLPAGEPVKLTLHGKVEKTHPYQLDFSGGSISALADPGQPWPVDLKLAFMSSQLSIKGNVTGDSGSVDFALGTQNLAEFEQLLQTALPAVGAANLSGRVQYAPGKIALADLQGFMGKTTIKGALNFDYGAARPRVQGELSLPLLDLRPFLTGKPLAEEAPPKSLAEVYREISRASFSLKALNAMDADLTLRVGKWLSLPGDVHDAMLQVKLAQGRLTVPLQVSLADVKLAGSASADARVSPARFKLALGTRDSSLGNLGELLLGARDVKGRLGRFDLRIAAQGDRGSALMKSLDVQLNVARADLSYGHGAGERPVSFFLDKLALALPAGKPLHGELQGDLLDRHFSATLHGAPLSSLMQAETAPLDFEMQAGSATAQIHALLHNSAGQSKSEVDFALAAPHSGEIAAWLGLKPGVDVPIEVRGNFHADASSWHLSGLALKLGRSDLAVDVLSTKADRKTMRVLSISSALIDLEQLQSLLPEAKQAPPADKPAARNVMDIPILPGGISLPDADIAVRLGHISSASAFAVRDARFDGKIRGGMLDTSPFSAIVAENNFSGAILIDLRTQQPHATFWLSADEIDLGSVLKKLGIASNIEAEIGHIGLQLDLHSRHLGQMLAQSELLANLDGGHIMLSDANSGARMRIALDHGVLASSAGSPLQLDMQGALNSVPLTIGIRTVRAADLINPKLPLPFELNAQSSGATVKLSGQVDRPFSKQDVELALDMRGSRFDNLNALMQTSLPPWGPWSATGKFHMSAAGYEVSALRLQVGTSELSGYGKLDMKVSPPRLDVALTAPSIQLDDFRFGDWSPEKAAPRKSTATVTQKASAANKQAQQLLSPQVLGRQNASLTLKVDQVVSGLDMLGNGKLEARLENGRAVLGPVLVNTAGGSASLLLKYEPGEKDVQVSLRAEAKNFDYGILARRVDRNSEMSGLFSLDVDVNAHARYFADILKEGKGHINFAVWPQNLKSGLLDVWAVNVLMALLPAVDSSNESKVNCVVAHFVLGDGRLYDKAMLIDTSRMRVSGKGGADFASQKINFYVQPRAKKPQFLSLAIPIELSGSFDDFSIGVRAEDALGSAGQFVTSLLWVPLKMLSGQDPPADGSDVCGAMAFK